MNIVFHLLIPYKRFLKPEYLASLSEGYRHRYVLYKPYPNQIIKKSFDTKSELMIWMDLNGYELGEELYKEAHVRDFHYIVGRTYSILEK